MFFFCFYNWGSVIKRVPIIGKDFLSHYELLVDCKNNRLIDATTSLAIQGHTAPPFIHSVKTVAAEVQLDPLLREFPELTTPAWINRKIHHNTVHHMKTTPGPPVACRPRRLDPRRLSIAKAEFSAMLQDGTARRANGPWSSALHLVPKKDDGWRPCGDYRALNSRTIFQRMEHTYVCSWSSFVKHATSKNWVSLFQENWEKQTSQSVSPGSVSDREICGVQSGTGCVSRFSLSIT